ncbi:mersacidin/lichenicidin family type 2 lantibiotic [Glycomyces salinus]|uniref:mersacidin/lichenicidin family type 2 lantibiotic n=1 Tax=Glycomyces salinus TaxID=980294 RepID=UPI0018ECFF86|nr:mersacidin/lichenicidin family type 2 lantibiotic [Glycomyces salinus]
MNDIRAWKDPERRHELGGDVQDNPAGLVDLNDDAVLDVTGGTSWWCATVALTATFCSPTGTMCGSCQFGTRGCC